MNWLRICQGPVALRASRLLIIQPMSKWGLQYGKGMGKRCSGSEEIVNPATFAL